MRHLKKYKLDEIYVVFDVYQYAFHCVFGPKDNVTDYVASTIGEPGDVWASPESHRGMFYHRTGRPPIIWMPRPPKTPTEYATLSHEILHVVRAMLTTQIGLPLTIDTDEAYCHAMSFAMRRVLEECR